MVYTSQHPASYGQPINSTMLERVWQHVGNTAASEVKAVAKVVEEVNSGQVRLTGNFRGCTAIHVDEDDA